MSASNVLYLFIALTVIIVFLGSMDIVVNRNIETRAAIKDLEDIMKNKFSEINITRIEYWNNLTIDITNNGQKFEDINLFVNSKVPKENYTIYYENDILNPGIIDKGESFNISANIELDIDTTHKLTVINEIGAKDSVIFYYTNTQLTVEDGQFNPDTGNDFTQGNLNAINDDLGGDVILSPLIEGKWTERAGLIITNHTFTNSYYYFVRIIADYTAPNIETGEFVIEARNSTYDGELFCSDNYGPVVNETRIYLMCHEQHPFSHSDINNLYVHMKNLGDIVGEQINIEHLRINVTHVTII